MLVEIEKQDYTAVYKRGRIKVSNEKSPAKESKKVTYDVMDLYKSSWETIKKNLTSFIMITLIGVCVSVAITAIATFALLNNILDSDAAFAITIFVTMIVGVLASVFITLLQVVALKKATEKGSFTNNEVIDSAWKYTPRAILYGLFITVVLIGATSLVVATSIVLPPLGVLTSIAFFVGLIVCLFRYAFVQFLIIEEKEMSFLERFKVSEKLTKNVYVPLFLLFAVGIGISIVASIAGTVLSAPFNNIGNNRDQQIEVNLENAESFEDISKVVKDSTKDAVKQQFTIGYIISTLITSFFSWMAGLLILGASLELYKKQKTLVLKA